MDQSHITKYRNTAEVFLATQNIGHVAYVFLDKARPLNVIHQAPSTTWPALVSALIQNGWSVKETEKQVTFLTDLIGSIPDWYPISPEDLANISLIDEILNAIE